MTNTKGGLIEYLIEGMIDMTEISVNKLKEGIDKCNTSNILPTKKLFDGIEQRKEKLSDTQIYRIRNLRERYVHILEELQNCQCQIKVK